MTTYCPICRYIPLEQLAIGNIAVYRCPNCGFYFLQHYGKLSYPLTSPPRAYLEKLKPKKKELPSLKDMHSITEWHKFLTEYGLSTREYRRLPENIKREIRALYRKYLRRKYAEKLAKHEGEDEYITSGALKGLKRSEIPLFEKWLNENLGIGLGDFYDQDPRIQADLRRAFRQWKREQSTPPQPP